MAASTKKYKSTSWKVAYQRKWREKRPQKNQTRLIPCYSGLFLQQKCFFFHLFFCDSTLLDGNLYQECATWSKKSSSRPQARREGKRKNPQNCIREEKKLEDLICFLFVNWRRKKKEALDALCVFSFVLRQSFLSGPPLRLGARRRSTYKRIDTNVLHLR